MAIAILGKLLGSNVKNEAALPKLRHIKCLKLNGTDASIFESLKMRVGSAHQP
jgi:hypothetical protein